MPDTRARYFTSQPSLPASRPVRADERVGRMLGCSADHAQRLRTSIIPEALAAILAACRGDSEKTETFRRRCLVALSDEPEIALSDDLLRRALRTDADADAHLTVALVGGLTPEEVRTVLPRLRSKCAVLTDLIRALEAQR